MDLDQEVVHFEVTERRGLQGPGEVILRVVADAVIVLKNVMDFALCFVIFL